MKRILIASAVLAFIFCNDNVLALQGRGDDRGRGRAMAPNTRQSAGSPRATNRNAAPASLPEAAHRQAQTGRPAGNMGQAQARNGGAFSVPNRQVQVNVLPHAGNKRPGSAIASAIPGVGALPQRQNIQPQRYPMTGQGFPGTVTYGPGRGGAVGTPSRNPVTGQGFPQTATYGPGRGGIGSGAIQPGTPLTGQGGIPQTAVDGPGRGGRISSGATLPGGQRPDLSGNLPRAADGSRVPGMQNPGLQRPGQNRGGFLELDGLTGRPRSGQGLTRDTVRPNPALPPTGTDGRRPTDPNLTRRDLDRDRDGRRDDGINVRDRDGRRDDGITNRDRDGRRDADSRYFDRDGRDRRGDDIRDRRPFNPRVDLRDRQNIQINRRPTWANVNNTTINTVNNQWNQAVVNNANLRSWNDRYPNRAGYWRGWGDGVRSNYAYNTPYYNNYFNENWWSQYRPAVPGWHYYNQFASQPYSYWWSTPQWNSLVSWFPWSAGNTAAWQVPVQYDYGQGGNVFYDNSNTVYVGGQPVGTGTDFAASAASLATVEAPPTEEAAARVDWKPLGTFVLSTNQKDTEPERIVQLAVNQNGVVSGTLFNQRTEQSAALQGSIDQKTQRVAFRVGTSDVVAETGLYNLTQNEVPLLVHFGPDQHEEYLLIRLTQPAENEKPRLP